MAMALALIHVIETNQIRVSYVVLYKVLILCNSCLKQLYLSNKTVHFSYKGGCVIHKINVHLSRHLKQELAWTIDKWLWFSNNTMLFKTVIPLRI